MFRARSRSCTRLTLVAAFLAVSTTACGKDKEGTNAPGGQAAVDVEAQAKARKQKARANSLVELANEDLRTGRYVSASRRAEEALEANPENADAHAILGAARWRAGDFQGSGDALRKAMELDPTNFGAVVGLGRNLQARGALTEAIELQDELLAKEKDQVDPLLIKLRSLYTLVQPDEAVKVLDELFKFLPADDPQLPVVQAHAAYLRALEGKGPFITVEGTSGKSDLALDLDNGLKHSLSVIGGKPVRAIFLELREEAVVDPGLVKKLKLKSVGEVTPVGSDVKQPIVILPAVKFGELTIKNVPAVVQDLSAYDGLIGEVPVILGRQVMHKLGTITFDFKGGDLRLTAGVPDAAPAGASEVPFLLLDLSVQNAPVVPISVDGSDHSFFAYFGGVFKAGVAITRKHYLKSGHLPRHLEELDDPNLGMKMVYVSTVQVGEEAFSGVGGLVMVNEPPDANLGQILDLTAFELGGYLNLTLIQNWTVTYALSSGKLFIQAPTG